MFEIGRLTRLNLGYTGEANSRPIEICVADWLADWPGAAIGLLLRRPGEDTFYPAKTSVENGVLKYTPTRADVELPGDGLAQIVLTDENDVELRSRVVRTCIEPSLPGSEAEAPVEPMRPFVDQVLEAAASALGSADNANEAANNAKAAADNAVAAADNAEAAADNAEAAAKRAEEAAGMIGPGGGGTGTVTSVNGVQPDEAGNVEIDIPEPPTKLGELEDDAEHRLVSDTEKAAWDAKSNFSGKYEDLSGKPTIPTKLSEMAADATHRLVTDTEKSAWNAKSNFSGKYADLTGKPTIPNVPSWALQSTKPTYTAAEVGALPSTYTPPNQTAAQVGADPAGTASSKVSTHNADEEAHPAIRQLINELSGRLSALADSDDTTLDQLSEIVAYIKSNKNLIDGITTGKVSTADIVNNLTSTATNKPLSAAQGKALKALIDAIVVPTKLSELAGDATHRVVTDAEKTAWNAKSTFSGAYADLTGKPTKVSAFENDAGYAKQGNVDALTEEIAKLPNDPTLIDNVSINVPIVKVAEQPTFVNGIEECTDTTKMYVLPNGNLAAYMKTEVTTEGSVTPDYTNILSTLIDADGNIYNGVGYKPDTRLSTSSGTSDQTGYIAFGFIPFQKGDVIRVKGINWISDNGAGNGNYSYVIWYEELGTTNKGSVRCNAVTDGVTTAAQFAGVTFAEDNGVFTVDTTNWNNSGYTNVKYMRISGYGNGDPLIVTKNQEIKDTVIPGGTEIITKWTDTGIEYNQPPDYSQRVTTLETKTAQLRNDVSALENKVGAGVGVAAGMTAFDVPAYAPAQLPADGSETADFDLRTEATIDGEKTLTTAKAYAYMDALVAKKPTYIIKQTMGKDESGDYDCNRYILANTYWKAWYKDSNPPMFAWKNDSTVIYSLSVSPRVGDTMYSTGDVSTEYGTVATVNCDTIAESTRTVNGLIFSRYADGDVEPTIFYTKPRQLDSKGTALWCEIFKADFTTTNKGSYDVHADYMISTSSDNNTKYIRYPFGDKKADKSSPIPVFVYANEHGQGGDNRCPSVVLMRMVKDLCENNHKIPFLTWLKDNCILTVIPVANPWGYESYLYDRDGYCNANYVNLNRNFDTPGWANFENTTQWEGSEGAFSPGNYVGSENETQYLMNTLHLSKAKVAFSMHGIPSPSATAAPYNLCTTIKGCGFDLERARSIEETLWNDYNCQVSWAIDEEQDYDHCAKSCAYIQYHGVVGGLTETIDWEESIDVSTGLAARYTSKVMEQGYTELLRCLQVWIEEALLKVFETEE